MTSLSRFSNHYGRSVVVLFGAVTAAYFLTYHTSLTPPLKPREAIFGISAILEVYAVLMALNAPPQAQPPLRIMLFVTLAYFFFLFSFTFLVPTSNSNYRDAIGFVCKRDFIELYGRCIWIDEGFLAKASFEPERIWEAWSIQLVRLFLASIWLLLVWAVTRSIAITVRQPPKRGAAKRSPRKKPMNNAKQDVTSKQG